MKNNPPFSSSWIFGIIFLITGVVVFATFLSSISEAQTNGNVANFETNINVNNYPPTTSGHVAWQLPDGGTISTFNFSTVPYTTLTGIVNGATKIIVNLNVTDPNGYPGSAINVQARLVRTNDSGANIAYLWNHNAASGTDCYIQPKFNPSNCTDVYTVSNTTHTWQCSEYNYFLSDSTISAMNPTFNFSQEHWRMWIEVTDGSNIYDDKNTIHYEWPNIIGIYTDPGFYLGKTFPGGPETPIASYLEVSNKGNTYIDILTSTDQTNDDAAWYCTGGGYPLVSDIHHNFVGAGTTNYNLMNALSFSGTVTNFTTFNLPRTPTLSGPMTKQLQFKFKTVQPIGPGLCTLSHMVITAVIGF